MTHNALGVVEGVAYSLAPAVFFDDSSGIASVLKGAMINNNLLDIEVCDTTGKVIGQQASLDSISHVHDCNDGVECICLEDDVLRISKSITHNGETIGRASVCFTLLPLKREVADSRRTIAILSLLIFALGMLLMLVVGRLVISRLWRIAHVSDAIAEGELGQRVVDNSDDEIGRLASTFNHMATSVQRADDSLRQQAALLILELTERKRAQAETNQLKEFLNDVINSMPSPLVAVEGDGRITLWNIKLEQDSGLDSDKLENAMVWDVLPILDEHRNIVSEAISSGVMQKRERLTCRHCSILRYVDVVVYPLHGDISGAVIRIDDVTEEVRMLELMAQTEKMMSVGGLAAGMAHEINNPLGIIVQSIQNLQRRVAPGLAKNADAAREVGISLESIHHYFEKRDIPPLISDILDAGKRAATIVTNMLNFSRHSSSGLLPASVGDIIHKAVLLAANDYDLKKKYDFRHITVTVDIDPAMPPIPCVDSKLEQVVLNLLKNAAQAIGEHGSNGSPSIVCRATAMEGFVQIEVEDNGPGMTEEVRRRVFEPFFTTKEVGTGTGLGLSVSYFIVTENHSGTMFVESAPGKGTKFVIKLPVDHMQRAKTIMDA